MTERSETVRHESYPRRTLISHLGTLFLIIGFSLPMIFYGPLLYAEGTYRLRKLLPKSAATHDDPYAAVVNRAPDPAFSLYIPKISAESRVIGNVDPWDKTAYMDALTQGIAHADNTSLPGNGSESIFLFAHSTDSPLNAIRNNAVFYLLRELVQGDEVFVSYKSKPYRYVVRDRKIVEPTEVSFLQAKNEENKEQLILQTCWPPGTTQKRMLIFADRVDGEQALLP